MKSFILIASILTSTQMALASGVQKCTYTLKTPIIRPADKFIIPVAEVLAQLNYRPATERTEEADYILTIDTNDIIKRKGPICTDLIGIQLNGTLQKKSDLAMLRFSGSAQKTFYTRCNGNQYNLSKQYQKAFDDAVKSIIKNFPECELE